MADQEESFVQFMEDGLDEAQKRIFWRAAAGVERNEDGSFTRIDPNHRLRHTELNQVRLDVMYQIDRLSVLDTDPELSTLRKVHFSSFRMNHFIEKGSSAPSIDFKNDDGERIKVTLFTLGSIQLGGWEGPLSLLFFTEQAQNYTRRRNIHVSLGDVLSELKIAQPDVFNHWSQPFFCNKDPARYRTNTSYVGKEYALTFLQRFLVKVREVDPECGLFFNAIDTKLVWCAPKSKGLKALTKTLFTEPPLDDPKHGLILVDLSLEFVGHRQDEGEDEGKGAEEGGSVWDSSCVPMRDPDLLEPMFRSLQPLVSRSAFIKVSGHVREYVSTLLGRLETLNPPETLSLLNNSELSDGFVRSVLLAVDDGVPIGTYSAYSTLGMKNTSNLDTSKTVCEVVCVEDGVKVFNVACLGGEDAFITAYKLYSTSFLGLNRENRHPPITSGFERFRWLYLYNYINKEKPDEKLQAYAKDVLGLLYNLQQVACTPSTYRVEFTLDGKDVKKGRERMREVVASVHNFTPMIAFSTAKLGRYIIERFTGCLLGLQQFLRKKPICMTEMEHLSGIMLFTYFINQVYIHGKPSHLPASILEQLEERGFMFPLLCRLGSEPKLPSVDDLRDLMETGFHQGKDPVLVETNPLVLRHLDRFMETLLAFPCTIETKGKVFVLLVLRFLYKDLPRTSCVILAEGGWPKKVSSYQQTPLQRFFNMQNGILDEGGVTDKRCKRFSFVDNCPYERLRHLLDKKPEFKFEYWSFYSKYKASFPRGVDLGRFLVNAARSLGLSYPRPSKGLNRLSQRLGDWIEPEGEPEIPPLFLDLLEGDFEDFDNVLIRRFVDYWERGGDGDDTSEDEKEDDEHRRDREDYSSPSEDEEEKGGEEEEHGRDREIRDDDYSSPSEDEGGNGGGEEEEGEMEEEMPRKRKKKRKKRRKKRREEEDGEEDSEEERGGRGEEEGEMDEEEAAEEEEEEEEEEIEEEGGGRATRIDRIAARMDLSFEQVEAILEHRQKARVVEPGLFPKGNKRFGKENFKKLALKVGYAFTQNQA